MVELNTIDETKQSIVMKNKIKRKVPFVIIIIISFYLLPLFGDSTGSFIALLLFIIPATTFITSFMYGQKFNMDLYFPLIIGILFIPTLFIYYNSTAWVYTVGYSVISLIGVFIGSKANNQ